MDSANPHSPFPKAPKSKRQAKKTKIGKERDDRMFQLRLVKSLNRGIKMTKSYLPANPGSMDRHSSWICEASDSRALQEKSVEELNINRTRKSCPTRLYIMGRTSFLTSVGGVLDSNMSIRCMNIRST